ncbi:hypothetical protein, partial [Vibrio parahaemolyticus]
HKCRYFIHIKQINQHYKLNKDITIRYAGMPNPYIKSNAKIVCGVSSKSRAVWQTFNFDLNNDEVVPVKTMPSTSE